MPPTSVQFWERIHAAALATPEECRNWAMQISKSASAESMRDSAKLAAELIRLGKITPFQANVLFTNLPVPLAIGPYRITESLESKLGPNWMLAMDSTRTKRNMRWCYLLTSQNMMSPEVQGWPPSVELGNHQVGVSHPSIDKWIFSGVDRSFFVAVCEALEGQALASLLANRPLNWTESVSMVEQIAAGLHKMHEAGIAHGCVCVDAVWCSGDGEFVLRRDPVFPPANPYANPSNSVLTSSREVPFFSAAPELTLANTAPSFQSDLYALGCLWFRSLTGSSPYGDGQRGSPQSWAKAHANQPARSLSPKELPPPLQQCLAHLLAKNPSARFKSAPELIKAIEVAVGQLEKQSTAIKERQEAPATEVIISRNPVPTVPLPKVPVPIKPSPPKPSPLATVPVEKPTIEQVDDAGLIQAELVNPSNKTAVEPIKDTRSKGDAIEPKVGSLAPETKPDPQPNNQPVSQPVNEPVNEPVTQPKQSVSKAPQAKKKKKPDTKQGGAKKKSKKKKKPVWFMPAMLVGACLVFGVIIAALVRNNGSTVAVVPTPATPPIPSGTSNEVVNSASNGGGLGGGNDSAPRKPADLVGEFFAVETDDGQLLWAPPQAGSPYSLEMFPAGLEAMVFVSGNLWHHRGIAGGIGKWWTNAQPELAKLLSGLPLLSDDRIQSVAIALYPSKTPGVPQAAFRMTFSQPVSIETVVQRAPGFSLQLFDPKNNPKKGLWSNEALSNPIGIMMEEMQTDSSNMIKRVVVGPQELLATLPELNGGTAPLRRQMETLLKTTDSRADLTALFAPSFLFGDGRELLGAMPKMQALLRDAIDESMQAVAITTTFEPRWYTELRLLSSDIKDAGRFSASLKSRLLGIPDEFEMGLAAGNGLHPYWRALGLRFPQMMRTLNRFGRFGLEDGQVVVNAYLPTDAISNVAVASWMALQNASFESTASNASGPKPTNKPPSKSMDEILEAKINVSFDQESLEAALQLISAEVAESVLAGSPVSMAINGTAFQKEGITRNQQVRAFKQKEIPLRVILTDLVRRANPVTTVQSATEVNQKVVWVVLDDTERPGQKKIELTTRTWAEANKVSLPKEFVAQ